MKIKMTIIAFFASVLILSSCMKNEVSPGIESVRTAYAGFLNAKGQAALIKANAEATLTAAKAQVELADAAYRLAQAAGVDAETADALASLQNDIAKWAIALDALQRAEDAEMNTYLKGVRDAKDSLAQRYFDKYVVALGVMRHARTAVFNKQAAILGLELDIVNGTTLTYDSLIGALAADEATLAALMAEYDIAVAMLGNVAAYVARQAELVADSNQFEAEIKNLETQEGEIAYLAGDLYIAKLAADAAYDKPVKASVDDSICDNFAEDFLLDTATYDSIPEFWGDALRALFVADSTLEEGRQDTLASYNLMTTTQATIDSSWTTQEAVWQAKVDSVGVMNLAYDALESDSASSWLTYATDSLQLEQGQTDTTDARTAHDALVVSMSGWFVIWHTFSETANQALATADSILYAQGVTDSTNYVDVLEPLARTITLPALVADTAATHALWLVDSIAFANETITAFVGAVANTTDATLYGRIHIADAAITTQKARVAAALLVIDDYNSDYLYWQTFMPELLAAVKAAEDNKEDLREAYEQWRDEYFVAEQKKVCDAYDEAVQKAKDDYDDDVLDQADNLIAKKAAQKAYDDATVIPLHDLDSVKSLREDQLDYTKTLITVYNGAVGFNETYLTNAFAALITTAEGDIESTEEEIVKAIKAYADGKIDYDEFIFDLANLNDELDAATAQVVFWKALLDEALAN